MRERLRFSVQSCCEYGAGQSKQEVKTAAAAAVFQVLHPRSGWSRWPLVVAIGLSRVYIGAHYVTDVAGGWVLGGAVGGGIAWMLRRRLKWHPVKRPLEESA